jgi:hypothetical protein
MVREARSFIGVPPLAADEKPLRVGVRVLDEGISEGSKPSASVCEASEDSETGMMREMGGRLR